MSGAVRRCATKAATRSRYEDSIFCRLLKWKCDGRSSSSSTPHKFTASSTRPLSSASEDPVAAVAVAAVPPPPSSNRWNLVKFGGLAALTGVLGTTAYATYAYTLDEVEEMSRPLLDSSNYSVGDDASALEKIQAMAYSAAMKVPVKFIEFYIDMRRAIEEQIRDYTQPSSDKLLPDLHPQEQHVFTLVLDLNETLVYSDWKRDRGWRTFKRPGVDNFLEHLAKFYEIVVYSDQLSMDLSKLNIDPSRVLYISGHASESSLQAENSVPIKPWKLESDDTALQDLIPFLEYVAVHRPADIRPVLASYQGRDITSEFIERSKEHQRQMQEQKHRGRFWRR